MHDGKAIGRPRGTTRASSNARRTVAALITAAAALAGPASADAGPDYGSFSRGVYLPYLNAAQGLAGHTPSLGISFGERMHTATMDSGSTGVVVAAAMIPGFHNLRSLGAGKLTYTSSGRVMLGQWVSTPMVIHGAEGTQARIVAMPVLAVTRVACLRQARNCTPNDNPTGIAMIGIGFAREADAQSQSTPDKNPFLHLDAEGRAYRRGYVLTPRGVHIGLTEPNTRGEFRYFKLDRDDARGDWSPVPACISINGRKPAACGSMLVDTGVTTMYLTVPAAQAAPGQRGLPPGTEVTVSLGAATSATPLYTFRTGDAVSGMAPKGVTLRVAAAKPFVNTSVNFLNGYDYLYDFDAGYVGFRRQP
jgi:hypothetical protein